MNEYVLEIDNITKTFGQTIANNDITLSFKKGEVHGLTGENGSGKSTLSSLICGVQKPDSGNMRLNGEIYKPKSSADARGKKVAMILQEMGVITNLTGSENIFLGQTDKFERFGMISKKKMSKEAKEQLKKWDLGEFELEKLAGELSIEHRKIIEMIRALSIDPDVLILDEVSQALSLDLRNKLHSLIYRLRDAGKTIIFISHDLEEVMDLCDRITVLRDGKLIDTRSKEDLSLNQLRELMVGREISDNLYRTDDDFIAGKEILLKVRNLDAQGYLSNINFELHNKEILAICGLSDGGIHELGKAIYGIDIKRTGDVICGKSEKQIKTPMDFIDAKGAYLSKDRDNDCLMMDVSVKENLFLPSAVDYKFWIYPKIPKKIAKQAVENYKIKTSGIEAAVGNLSGGNKQKINLSRWMMRDVDFVILDCATRGVDIGVKAAIYQIIAKARANGLGIIMICDEMVEAIGMADRILVMKEGAIRKEFARKDGFSEKKLVEVMV